MVHIHISENVFHRLLVSFAVTAVHVNALQYAGEPSNFLSNIYVNAHHHAPGPGAQTAAAEHIGAQAARAQHQGQLVAEGAALGRATAQAQRIGTQNAVSHHAGRQLASQEGDGHKAAKRSRAGARTAARQGRGRATAAWNGAGKAAAAQNGVGKATAASAGTGHKTAKASGAGARTAAVSGAGKAAAAVSGAGKLTAMTSGAGVEAAQKSGAGYKIAIASASGVSSAKAQAMGKAPPPGPPACEAPRNSTHDNGFWDEFQGWYDVQGCGLCNDYCRWVGSDGSGGHPSIRQETGNGSFWSCRLAGSDTDYSPRGMFTAWSKPKCPGGMGSQAPCMAPIWEGPEHDGGFGDEFRGWYDVQGCGTCNDYCRWVGALGSGGDPKLSVSKGRSWWSCALAGSNTTHTLLGHFGRWDLPKCDGRGAQAPQRGLL